MARDKLRQVYGVGITQISDHNIRHEKPIRFNDKEYATKWEVDEDTMFLVEDYTKDKHVKLIKARIHNNLGRHKNIVWVRDYERDPKKWRSFLRLLGFPPKFYKLEDFVLPEREKLDRATFAPRIKKNEVRIIRFDRYEDVVDLNTLPSNTRYVISHNGTLWVDENYDNYVYEQTVRNLFEDTSNILVVKQKSLNKVKAAGVTNALTERRDDLARDLDFESFVAKSNLEKYLNHWIKDYASELSTLEYESDTSFKKVLDFMRKYVKTESTEQSENAANIMLWQKLVTSTVFYAKQNEFTIPKPEDDETLSYWVGKIVEEYPLTKKYIGKHWDDGTFSSDLEHIFNYIKMVDKFNAENCVS
jgi:hypothetical protein